jgi:fructokinase
MAEKNDTSDKGDPAEPALASPADGRPVIVGEVLFDDFQDRSRVLGGAPFNVAWHLQAFGLEPVVVTRIGDDELGAKIVAAMDDWGMDRRAVQVDPSAPTGRVEVDLDGDGPAFDILPDQAYDRLDSAAAVTAVRSVPTAVLYHGSLLARSEAGRRALHELGAAVAAPVFMDVNLRDPWWDAATVLSLLDHAQWAKLNDDELDRLADPPDDPAMAGDAEATAERFARRHDLGQLVITCGARGAMVFTDGRLIAGRPPESIEVVDTVGAGDAFSAVWIAGALGGWATGATVARALDFAAMVCGHRGATTDERRLYDNTLAAWEDEG